MWGDRRVLSDDDDPPARIFRRGTNERTVYSDCAKYTEARGKYIQILGHIFRSIVRFDQIYSDAAQNCLGIVSHQAHPHIETVWWAKGPHD